MAARGPELRIGLVGLGRVAERGYLPALAAARGVRLAAVAEPDAARRARAPAGVPALASAGELLDAVEVDALVLATPSASHAEGAALAAARGLPCLVEKPPAPDLAGAVALAALEPEPALGFCRRFVPALAGVRAAASRLDGYRLELALDARRDDWRAYVAEDGPLLDLGSHQADLVRWLPGDEPRRVRALGEDEPAFEVELERGAAVVRCSHRRPWRESVVLRDAEGRRVAAWADGGLVRRLRGRLGGSAAGGPLVPLLAAQLEAFSSAARGGERGPLAGARDGVEAMRLLEAVRASADARGAWIELEPDPSGGSTRQWSRGR